MLLLRFGSQTCDKEKKIRVQGCSSFCDLLSSQANSTLVPFPSSFHDGNTLDIHLMTLFLLFLFLLRFFLFVIKIANLICLSSKNELSYLKLL